jgi:uncharacterized protein (TIGR00369 family)
MSEPMTVPALQAKLDRSPFGRFLGLTIAAIDHGREEVVIAMPMRPEFERSDRSGQYHGGVIASLIDIAGDFALILKVGAGVPTINFRVDYLRPASNTGLKATATARRLGRTIGVVDIDVHDDAGRLIAVGRGCYGMQAG